MTDEHRMRKEHAGHNIDKERCNNYHLTSTGRDCPCGWTYLSGFGLLPFSIRQKCSWPLQVLQRIYRNSCWGLLWRPRRKFLNRGYWSSFSWVAADKTMAWREHGEIPGCDNVRKLHQTGKHRLIAGFFSPKTNWDRTWNQTDNQV